MCRKAAVDTTRDAMGIRFSQASGEGGYSEGS
jgi:hypothetical protein